MAQSSTALHESAQDLGPELIDHHRVIVSLMEELEAVDWYNQRVKAATDQELRAVLAHNRDEEKEHAAMLLEWLRRHDKQLAGHLEAYLFRKGPIREQKDVAAEDSRGVSTVGSTARGQSLGVGSLRNVEPM